MAAVLESMKQGAASLKDKITNKAQVMIQTPQEETLPQQLLRQADEATTLTWKQVGRGLTPAGALTAELHAMRCAMRCGRQECLLVYSVTAADSSKTPCPCNMNRSEPLASASASAWACC